MNASYRSQSDKEKFYRELQRYRSTAKKRLELVDEESVLIRRVNFFISSTKFYIAQLDVWDVTGDITKYNETVERIRESLDQLHSLIGSPSDDDTWLEDDA